MIVAKNYIKGGLKAIGNYGATLIIYVILFYAFMAITGESFDTWLPLYSCVMFVIMAVLLYTDMWHLAAKEKRPQYELSPYPLKGLVLGLLGVLPLVIIVVLGYSIVLSDEVLNALKLFVVERVILGPVYFIIALFNKTIIGYIVALLSIPLLAMLGYIFGYYGIQLGAKIKIKNEVSYEKKQELSPWNPAKKVMDEGKKKKKK